ncbi:MAG TPA: hypothetical protein VHV83_02370 [Armatimonadota bacterium]|nr:hypothetical protein [Armatimonadota bacterium]
MAEPYDNQWMNLPLAQGILNADGQALSINGHVYPPYAYMSYFGKREYYQQAAAAGIHLYCVPAYLGDRGINTVYGLGPFRKGIWRDEGVIDVHEVTEEITTILSVDPDAKVIIRLYLDAPSWWEAKYPEGCTLLPDGSTLRQSFTSLLWRTHTAAAMRLVMHQLSDMPLAAHLVGIHIAAGCTEEWFYHYKRDLGFYNENPDRLAAFRQWLSDSYEHDLARLRAAWQNDEVDFSTAKPTDISCSVPEDRWRDVEQERPIIDTFRFHAETIAGVIGEFCHVVKDESHGRLLTGAFYGYSFGVSDPRQGHFALAKLLQCPDLDMLASPNTYNRVPGEDWSPYVAVDSVRLHGKLWFAENDTRTCRTTLLPDVAPSICPPGRYADGVWLGPKDLNISVNLLWKDAGRMLAHGYGGWWFDMWGGWFDDPAMLEVFQRLQHMADEYPNRHLPAIKPEVCVILDEELCFRDASCGRLSEEILGNRRALGNSGIPYDIFLSDDLDRLPADYRFIWLLGAEDMHHALSHVQPGGTILSTTPAGSTLYNHAGEALESFPGLLRWTPASLRAKCRAAGVHLYSESDDVLYAGHGWVVLHAAEAGEKTLSLPCTARITDVIHQTVLTESSSRITLPLQQYETALLYVEPISQ